MGQAVNLIALRCVRCSTLLPAEPDQMAWACQVCGQGLYLDDQQGLLAQEIYYAASLPPGATGKPFWVVDGQATVQRETFGSAKTNQAQEFWRQPRRFFVPAYAATLEERLETAMDLLQNPPNLQPGPAARFESVVLEMQDVRAAAEFILVAVEAARSDRLKKIDFQLKLSQPILWILPA